LNRGQRTTDAADPSVPHLRVRQLGPPRRPATSPVGLRRQAGGGPGAAPVQRMRPGLDRLRPRGGPAPPLFAGGGVRRAEASQGGGEFGGLRRVVHVRRHLGCLNGQTLGAPLRVGRGCS